MSEAEPNGTIASANFVAISATPVMISGSMSSASDIDYFRFALTARSGVFLDVDSRETGRSTTLDSAIDVLDTTGGMRFGFNDDGRDFDTLALNESTQTPLLFGDSALYLDLPAGTYIVKMSASSGSGAYDLKITADSVYTAGVPVHSSLPGAADTLYLDFDGHAATDAWNNGNAYSIAPFDLNGNGAEFTPGERLAVYNAWRVVADAYAPFNINVTTSYDGEYDDGVAHRQVIGNSDGGEILHHGKAGVALTDGYNSGGATTKTGFTFATYFADNPGSGISGKIVANAIEIGNTSAEMIGIAMGLATYTVASQHHAFMCAGDDGLNRERWSFGTNGVGAAQDDLATIADAKNTFGYRADDHADSRSAATVLSTSGSTYAASGVIHNTADLDVFRFSGSGVTTITLDIPEHLGHLDAQIHLYTAAGALIASADPATRLGGSIDVTLPAAGAYYVEVRSDGDYGDLGMYDLRIATVVPPTGAIAGRVFRDVTLNHIYEPAAGDTAIGNVTLYLDTDDDGIFKTGEPSTLSLDDGTFAFTGLADGPYHVKQVTPAGHVSDISYDLVVSGDVAHANIDFGNFPIVYNGSAGGDHYIVRLKAGAPATLEIVESFSALTYAAPSALVWSLTVNGGAGDDTLTLAAELPAAMLFNGGTDAGSTDTLNVAAGTYTFDADARAGTANLVLNVTSAAGAVVFNATQHIESLNIIDGVASVATNGSFILVTDTLTISGGGKLDLRNNDMIVHSGTVGAFDGSAYGGITGYLAAGYHFGESSGNGIVTSMPAAGPLVGITTLAVGTGYDVYGLGAGDVAQWQGESIAGSSIVIKYTYAGDLNLDGLVDAADYGVIDNWIQFPGTWGYANGDFDYDGVIDAADYGIIDNSVHFQDLPL